MIMLENQRIFEIIKRYLIHRDKNLLIQQFIILCEHKQEDERENRRKEENITEKENLKRLMDYSNDSILTYSEKSMMDSPNKRIISPKKISILPNGINSDLKEINENSEELSRDGDDVIKLTLLDGDDVIKLILLFR